MQQGDRLAAWRIKNQLSQEAAGRALAKHLPQPSNGVGQATWAAWELGKKAPDLTNAIALELLTDGHVKTVGWRRTRRKQRRARLARTGTDG